MHERASYVPVVPHVHLDLQWHARFEIHQTGGAVVDRQGRLIIDERVYIPGGHCQKRALAFLDDANEVALERTRRASH